MKRDAPPQIVQDIFEPDLSAIMGILLLLIYHLRKFKKFIKPAKPNEDRTWKRGCNRLLRKIPGIQRRHKETDEGQHFHRCAQNC